MRTEMATKAAIMPMPTPTAVHDLIRRGFWYSRLLTTKVIGFLPEDQPRIGPDRLQATVWDIFGRALGIARYLAAPALLMSLAPKPMPREALGSRAFGPTCDARARFYGVRFDDRSLKPDENASHTDNDGDHRGSEKEVSFICSRAVDLALTRTSIIDFREPALIRVLCVWRHPLTH
jgi:hypothetical protein